MKKKQDYMDFKVIEKKTKTVVVEVTSKLHGFKLGIIKWFSRWRQYCFFPVEGTIYNKDCLREIADNLEQLKIKNKEVYQSGKWGGL